jgi:C-terminal processing protease CtpA/Prc
MDMEHKTTLEIVEQIADLLAEKHVFPQVGEELADHLRQRIAENAPFLALPSAEFADAFTQELYALAQDSHLRLDYSPERAAGVRDTEALMQRHGEQARRNNFGFIKLERLAGNIGYLLVREFPPPAETIAAGAMAFLENTQALIFDVRGHKGGSPEMVQLLISYLVEADPHPLSGIYARATGQTQVYQTLPSVPGQRMPKVPVYILVDRQTHSAAEAFAYDLQALRRATVVGERTRGGAHLVDFIPLHDMFVLMLPIARAINPITGNNWQGTGVIPDIEVPAEQALPIAHERILNELLASAKDADEKAFLQAEMETLHLQ